ncbi:MAG: hypothetical protein HY261_10750 [Chloroflexi bacterium]|nr:hypothetical protein [Chloroflexota bacterium]
MAKPVRRAACLGALLVLAVSACTTPPSGFYPTHVPNLADQPPADAPPLAKSGTHVFVYPRTATISLGDELTFSVWVDSDKAISGGEVRLRMPFADFEAGQCGQNGRLAACGGNLFGGDPTTESGQVPDSVGLNTPTPTPRPLPTPDRAIGINGWADYYGQAYPYGLTPSTKQLVFAEARKGPTPAHKPGDGVTRHWFVAFRIKVARNFPDSFYPTRTQGELDSDKREGIRHELDRWGAAITVEAHFLDENLKEIPLDSVTEATLKVG